MKGLLAKTAPQGAAKPDRCRPSTPAKVLGMLAVLALLAVAAMLFLALFEPPLPYSVPGTGSEPVDFESFARTLAAVTGGDLYHRNRVEVLTNGDVFYDAELAAIRAARRFVHLEAYLFSAGRITDRILNALVERARAGVAVRVIIDAIGSAGYPDGRFEPLRAANGRAARYHPLKWYTWPRINHRTHRELLVVDGTVGFLGGAGFGDQWAFPEPGRPRWRDTMVRVEGDAVTGLQAAFAENWLEATGEMLVNPDYYPFQPGPGATPMLVVSSSPTSGRSTQARILFQTLLAKAGSRVRITSPYFLPDDNLVAEIARAVRDRGVDVRILVPGPKIDHAMTRSSSRGLYGNLFEAGARIYEYQPSMIHAKVLLVDGAWAVVGSTNMDARSFGLNDEVNAAILDPGVAGRLERDFENDLRSAREITYEQWRRRPDREKVEEWIGWLFARQQ